MTKKKSNITKKPNAKQGLIPQQFPNLNNMFYRDFMYDYFDIKITNLLYIITKSTDFSESVKNSELEIGEIKFVNPVLKEDLLVKYAKSEIVSTYYHCLETFMRLFIAHATIEKCPWVEVTCLDIPQYKKIIKEIAKGNFDNLNNKFNEQETILDALIGIRNIKKIGITKEQYNNLKNWIIWCAQELLEIGEYNSLKHGLAFFPSFGAMKINAGVGELSKEGEAINILSREETESRYILSNKTIFVEYDFKVAIIHMFSEMIRNIIIVGKLHYLGTEEKHIKIPGLFAITTDFSKFRDMFIKKKNLGNLLRNYGINLFYYDDLKELGGSIVINESIYEEKVPDEILPKRLDSASCLYISVKSKNEEGIVVYNINPTTWNMWCPFFETKNKFTINDFKIPKDITYKELIDIYNKEYSKYENEYPKQKRIELLLNAFKELYKIDNIKANVDLETIYEIKYSKTMNVFTIYRIENFVLSEISELDKFKLLNQQQFVQSILPYECEEQFQGVSVVTNMVYSLKNKDNIAIFKQSQINLED